MDEMITDDDIMHWCDGCPGAVTAQQFILSIDR